MMKQYEAVIQVMEENGGFATLGYLYQNVLQVRNSQWNTKTPFASIRRIVQDTRFFFKIKPGLWALKYYRKKLPSYIYNLKSTKNGNASDSEHTYYQGLLVEIGNFKNYATFIPNQDKNRIFLGNKLGELRSMPKFYEFGYSKMIKRACTIDVSWFNRRNMPCHFFEVEHSTNFYNSLLKYSDLQDFNTKLFIVSHLAKKNSFQKSILSDAFFEIKNRVKFLDYESLSEWHSRIAASIYVERNLDI